MSSWRTCNRVMKAGIACEMCGENTEKKIVKKQHWLKGKFYIIENVEAEVYGEW